MIEYEGTKKVYRYNCDYLNNIIEMLESHAFDDAYNVTQEQVKDLIDKLNRFISNISVSEEKTILKRHETEEEAREYFGMDFISQLNQLFTRLDEECTIVSIHGTDPSLCQSICDVGLLYKMPSLSATAVGQSMAYGEKESDFNAFESLLNWGHKSYKGLVILAIPYECYYKEGVWNHFQDSKGAMGSYDYKINPDFIVGYIDVDKKQIILNPKYNRQHNYQGLVPDSELFHKRENTNNETIKKELLEYKRKTNTEERKPIVSNNTREETIDIERLSYMPDRLIGLLNSVKLISSDTISEEKYRDLLENLSYCLHYLEKAIPLLETEEQKKERLSQQDVFTIFSNDGQSNPSEEYDFGDGIDWDDPKISK